MSESYFDEWFQIARFFAVMKHEYLIVRSEPQRAVELDMSIYEFSTDGTPFKLIENIKTHEQICENLNWKTWAQNIRKMLEELSKYRYFILYSQERLHRYYSEEFYRLIERLESKKIEEQSNEHSLPEPVQCIDNSSFWTVGQWEHIKEIHVYSESFDPIEYLKSMINPKLITELVEKEQEEVSLSLHHFG
jgi:hypothetical protein